VYLDSFLGPTGHYDFKSGGASETLVKGQGSTKRISDYGA